MNNMQADKNIKVKRGGKDVKISVDFEGKMSFGERLKLRIMSSFFLTKVVWTIFRLVLLLGIAYVILLPFITKIAGSFMSIEDFLDVTVNLIPKYPTFDTYKYIFIENKYLEALTNTAILSGLCAVVQMMTCAVIGYGLSKFKFRGNKIVFVCVILTMIIPHQTLQTSMFMKFRYFDIYGIYEFIYETFCLEALYVKNVAATKIWQYPYFNLINTYWPLAILSIGGLAFKNGLYIFMMRQFYKGVPDELEEAAYVDGSGVIRTFVKIILPLSVPMMITIFLCAFSWQWTDSFYTNFFFTQEGMYLMPDIVKVPQTLSKAAATMVNSGEYFSAINNTCGLMILLPLLIMYCFCQKYLVQGIERSGIVG